MEDDGKAWTDVRLYQSTDWLNPSLIHHLADFGPPAVVTQWSASNYVEACFKTFDRDFLQCRASKRYVSSLWYFVSEPDEHRLRPRLDQLLLILVETSLPFYEYLPWHESRADPKLERAIAEGFHLWEIDCIQACPQATVPEISRETLQSHSYCCLFQRERFSNRVMDTTGGGRIQTSHGPKRYYYGRS